MKLGMSQELADRAEARGGRDARIALESALRGGSIEGIRCARDNFEQCSRQAATVLREAYGAGDLELDESGSALAAINKARSAMGYTDV